MVRVEFYLGIDELPWHVDVAFIACVFMYIGHIYNLICKRYYDNYNQGILVLLSFFSIIVGSFIGFFNGRINMVKNQYQNGVLFVVSATLIVYGVMTLVRTTGDMWGGKIKNVLSFWVANTIIFMGFNYFFNILLRQLFGFISLEETIAYTITDIIVVMIGCSYIIILWQKIKLQKNI